ncbi:hypothetical protein FOMG_11501 [Fusarium oxysporum f. sp. melonis 26406]|uniref:Nephrocystin 3-like N-terminal domain-containing protein n=1 Tax=Fusarium oxysporum f. sp. melonis 26406 TaxID=1089452 RepID=X0AHG3_FUSOX|nr:hypothetical protein FOMG_11501 [Fusarium oxysporum f. sp. melonis 26406]
MNGSIERMDESEMESSPNRRTRTGRLMPFAEMIGRFKMNMLHYPRLEQYRWVDVKPSEGRCASDGFQLEVGLKTATLGKNAYCTGEPDPELSIYAQEPRHHRFNCPMQISFKGFLCSLVYQLLSLDKEHAIGCLQQDPNWSRKTVPGDWDSEDLQYLLSSYLSQAAQPFCLFIDGLDELMEDSGIGILINLLNSLQISSRLVKVCMPSRPEQATRTRQSREPDLKMQDST